MSAKRVPVPVITENATASLAVVYAALRALEGGGNYVRIADVMADARARL